MHQHHRTKGIFLKKEDRGEADQVFSIFTCDFGRVEVVAKAIRKIISKLRSGADIFYLSEIEFIQGKSQKILTDAGVIDKFFAISQDPEKMDMAFRISEIINSLTGIEEKDEKMWKLALEVFQVLSTESPSARGGQIIFDYFFWNFVNLLGYHPELYHCFLCAKKILPETLFFSTTEGGVLCWQCLAKIKKEKAMEAKEKGEKMVANWLEIKVDTVKALRFILNNKLESVLRLSMEKEIKKNLMEISGAYFSFLKEALGK